jgi:hypothetical protein
MAFAGLLAFSANVIHGDLLGQSSAALLDFLAFWLFGLLAFWLFGLLAIWPFWPLLQKLPKVIFRQALSAFIGLLGLVTFWLFTPSLSSLYWLLLNFYGLSGLFYELFQN